MDADLFGRLFRTALQVGGSVLATWGIMDETTWATLSGALLTIGTTVFTWIAARKAAAAQ